jgi:hypothetical protein
MPLIKIKFFQDEFAETERTAIISTVTDTIVSFTVKPSDPHLGPARRDQERELAIGGTALGLADVRGLQGTDRGTRTH